MLYVYYLALRLPVTGPQAWNPTAAANNVICYSDMHLIQPSPMNSNKILNNLLFGVLDVYVGTISTSRIREL